MAIKFGTSYDPRSTAAVGSITAAGTSAGGAAALVPGFNLLTTSAGETAVKLPASQDVQVVCRTVSATTAVIFPPTGGAINGGSVDAKVDLATTKVGVFIPHSNGLDYTFQLGA